MLPRYLLSSASSPWRANCFREHNMLLQQASAPPAAITARAAPRARPVAMTHSLKACMPRSQRAALATAPRARQMRLGRVVSVRAEEGDAAVVKVEPPKTGTVSKYLAQNGLKHKSLGFDYQGVEMIQVMREDLMSVCAAIYTDGWNYLRNQCGYDSEPGGDLVSVYHIAKMDPETNDSTPPPEEVCIKVFLPRDDPTCPSVFSIWQTADWQERETYDMYGIVYENHPHLTRILMPEHWEGWPMRKDYITPDFYELQDAY